MPLTDVLGTGYTVKNSLLTERISKLTRKGREKNYDAIAAMMKHSQQERS